MTYSQNCEYKYKVPAIPSGREEVFGKFNYREIKYLLCPILSLVPACSKWWFGWTAIQHGIKDMQGSALRTMAD